MKIYTTEAPRHREENAMRRLFWPREYRGQNKRRGFSKEYIEREEFGVD